MSEKENCWEFMHCGREPGGRKVVEFGECPVATNAEFDGVNGGQNGGRFCWAISGSYCKGEIQGTFARKFSSCLVCPFFVVTSEDEGRLFALKEDDLIENPYLYSK